MRAVIMLVLVWLVAGQALAQDGWTHAGHSPSRVSLVASAAPDLTRPAWIYDAGGTFEAIAQATPVISEDGVVVTLGFIDGDAYAVALEAATGEELWRAPIAAPVFVSWSSPALTGTREGGVAVIASGTIAVALDLGTGDEVWRSMLGQSVVNASPAIEERSGVVRLTTYDPFGGSARLITLDLATGEVLLDPTIGSASGASPALHGLRSFVALTNGAIKAYDGGDAVWTAENPIPTGFFGGVVYHDGAVYAASYGFSGGRENSNIVKLDAATGDQSWSVASERTDSMPIPLVDGRVVLSAGLEGFGSLPTVQMYVDRGTSADRAWDLASATWDDLNGNDRIDPGEYLALGGWDHQPALLDTADGTALLVGGPTGGLALLDLDADPGSDGFVMARTDLGGGSPAVARGVAISAWDDQVVAFALEAGCDADFDGDGSLTIFDFLAYQNAFDSGETAADCDDDGSLTIFDFLCFQNAFDAGCP